MDIAFCYVVTVQIPLGFVHITVIFFLEEMPAMPTSSERNFGSQAALSLLFSESLFQVFFLNPLCYGSNLRTYNCTFR